VVQLPSAVVYYGEEQTSLVMQIYAALTLLWIILSRKSNMVG